MEEALQHQNLHNLYDQRNPWQEPQASMLRQKHGNGMDGGMRICCSTAERDHCLDKVLQHHKQPVSGQSQSITKKKNQSKRRKTSESCAILVLSG
jgi:hypothetical protein